MMKVKFSLKEGIANGKILPPTSATNNILVQPNDSEDKIQISIASIIERYPEHALGEIIGISISQDGMNFFLTSIDESTGKFVGQRHITIPCFLESEKLAFYKKFMIDLIDKKTNITSICFVKSTDQTDFLNECLGVIRLTFYEKNPSIDVVTVSEKRLVKWYSGMDSFLDESATHVAAIFLGEPPASESEFSVIGIAWYAEKYLGMIHADLQKPYWAIANAFLTWGEGTTFLKTKVKKYKKTTQKHERKVFSGDKKLR